MRSKTRDCRDLENTAYHQSRTVCHVGYGHHDWIRNTWNGARIYESVSSTDTRIGCYCNQRNRRSRKYIALRRGQYVGSPLSYDCENHGRIQLCTIYTRRRVRRSHSNDYRSESHLTFKANIGVSRHGWLRLTPAYSYSLVKDSLRGLALLKQSLDELSQDAPADNLLLIAFCRVMIGMSNAAFNHQSMSFQKPESGQTGMFAQGYRFDEVFERFTHEVENVLGSVRDKICGTVTVNPDDARTMESVADGSIDGIHTSPPYCNRMSYICELRPYTYWLGYLFERQTSRRYGLAGYRRHVGERDKPAIGLGCHAAAGR